MAFLPRISNLPLVKLMMESPSLWANLLRVVAQKNFSQSKSLSKVYEVKDANEFEDKVILNPRAVIVNFHADWCEPCHILTPKLEEMVVNSRSVDLVNLNCDDHVELLETFEVKAVPAIIAFKNGLIVDKFVGLVDARQINTFVQKLDSEL